jgi:hypothetical protein
MAMTDEDIRRRAGIKTAKEMEQERLDSPVTRRDVRRWAGELILCLFAWKIMEALGCQAFFH